MSFRQIKTIFPIFVFLLLPALLLSLEPPARKELHDAFYNDTLTSMEESEVLFQAALKEAERTPEGSLKKVNLAWCYYLMSRICGNAGDKKRAEKLCDTAFDYAEEALDENENAETLLIYTNSIAQNCTVKSFFYVITQGIRVNGLAKDILEYNPRCASAMYLRDAQTIYAPAPFYNYKDGIECMKAILADSSAEFEPYDYFDVYTSLAYALINSDKKDEAAPYLAAAAKIYPGNSTLLQLMKQ
ncbi:MAG: hypothetical protein K5930_00715 [Treponemataceae bacterium]|nr:hypothetical protein [Treponemataceae bacterium]